MDPALRHDRAKCSEFVLRLEAAGMLSWCIARGRRGNLGAFFVYKKNRSDPRLVFDTRVVNCESIEAPCTRLPSAAVFSSGDAAVRDLALFVRGHQELLPHCRDAEVPPGSLRAPRHRRRPRGEGRGLDRWPEGRRRRHVATGDRRPTDGMVVGPTLCSSHHARCHRLPRHRPGSGDPRSAARSCLERE